MANRKLIRLASNTRDMTTRWFQTSQWNGSIFKHTKYNVLPRLLYIFKRENYKGEIEYDQNIDGSSDFAHDNLHELDQFVQNWWDNNEALTHEYERELDDAIYEAIQAHNDKWTRKLEDDVNNNLIPQIRARTTARQTVTE